MKTLCQAFQVEFRYPVHFTADLFAPENPLFAAVVAGSAGVSPAQPCGRDARAPGPCGRDARAPGARPVLFVIDEGVRRHHPGLPAAIEAYCRRHQIPMAGAPRRVPGGERVKNEHDWVLMLHHAIERAGLCRHSFLAAIGGGAVLDMAGLAAATAHRGVRLIRIPTTVLSQNDSGVGVKNGINAFGKKNFLGTFAPPYAVLNDARFLTTLSDRDWRSGIAEAIKVALVRDAAFFEWLEENAAQLGGGAGSRDIAAMQRLIYRCAELHLQHIATGGDPFEYGSARPLDFGHWAAHKLEQLSGYRLRHGEAVAIGIALDTTYSYRMGLLAEADWQRVLRLLHAVGLAIHAPELSGCGGERSLLQGLDEFREHLGGALTITLLAGIGRGREVHEIDERRMGESLVLLERQGVRCSGKGVGEDGRHPTPDTLPPTPYHCRIPVAAKGEPTWIPVPKGRRAPVR